MTALRCCMKEACAEGNVSSATRVNPGRGTFMKGRRPGKRDPNKGVIVTRQWDRTASPRVSLALAVLFAFTLALPGCSTRNDSLPELGTVEDYLARRENTAYIYGYGPYDLCEAYDPYCLAPYWYSTPIDYFSRGDGDNDCDDGRCRGLGNGFHHTLATHSPRGFSAPVPSARFGPPFVTGGFSGRSRR
jgi:hypothetical protein